TRNSRNHSTGHLPDAVVAGVGYVEIARAVYRDAIGVANLSAGSRPIVARVAKRAVTRHRGDHSTGYLPDAVVAAVGYVEVARAVYRDAIGVANLGAGGRPIVA